MLVPSLERKIEQNTPNRGLDYNEQRGNTANNCENFQNQSFR